MNDVVTADLSMFGYRELREAAKLLNVYIDNKHDLDVGEGLRLCFNTHSGFVFLTDEDYRVFMINDETQQLEEWFNCPICGCEGFKDYVTDIKNHDEPDEECREWIQDIKDQ